MHLSTCPSQLHVTVTDDIKHKKQRFSVKSLLVNNNNLQSLRQCALSQKKAQKAGNKQLTESNDKFVILTRVYAVNAKMSIAQIVAGSRV